MLVSDSAQFADVLKVTRQLASRKSSTHLQVGGGSLCWVAGLKQPPFGISIL